MNRLGVRLFGDAWTEWMPCRSDGRLTIGRLVIMRRAEFHDSAWRHMRLGARIERERPGTIAQVESELQAERAPADRLHLV